MTLPGAETMNEGIMGEDCLRCMAGAEWPFEGRAESSFEGIVSTGEAPGV
jgi:hypothetical protein